MTTWKYQLFVVASGEPGAEALEKLQGDLNDLGREGWELTAVTDAGNAKIFIFKQREEIHLDPFAQD